MHHASAKENAIVECPQNNSKRIEIALECACIHADRGARVYNHVSSIYTGKFIIHLLNLFKNMVAIVLILKYFVIVLANININLTCTKSSSEYSDIVNEKHTL